LSPIGVVGLDTFQQRFNKLNRFGYRLVHFPITGNQWRSHTYTPYTESAIIVGIGDKEQRTKNKEQAQRRSPLVTCHFPRVAPTKSELRGGIENAMIPEVVFVTLFCRNDDKQNHKIP
jgi:hypothetical protein